MSSKVELQGAEVPSTVGAEESPEYVMVRRRRGRRKHRSLDVESPQQRFRMILLIIVVCLIIVTIAGRSLKRIVEQTFHVIGGIVPAGASKTMLRPELIVLLLVALILIYLMVPSLEAKVTSFFVKMLGFLGIRVHVDRRRRKP